MLNMLKRNAMIRPVRVQPCLDWLRREDLVILSAPDGKKHFAEASKVAEHPVLQSEANGMRSNHLWIETYLLVLWMIRTWTANDTLCQYNVITLIFGFLWAWQGIQEGAGVQSSFSLRVSWAGIIWLWLQPPHTWWFLHNFASVWRNHT